MFTAQGGVQSITIDGVAITQVGQTIQGQFGTMTITGIDLNNGQITYSYTLADNTSGDNTSDHFSVVVTDNTGDTASATLTVNIVTTCQRAQRHGLTDLVSHIATGNVVTGADTTSGPAGADTVGADNATLTAISSNNVPANSDNSADGASNYQVAGEFGTLTINADDIYTYTENQELQADLLTFHLHAHRRGWRCHHGDAHDDQSGPHPDHGANPLVELDYDALPGGNPGGPGDTPDAVNTTARSAVPAVTVL